MKNTRLISFILIAAIVIGGLIISSKLTKGPSLPEPEILPTPSPTPTPTPRPLTFAEMNVLYGPCVKLPTLTYHHVQSQESAEAKGQTSLTVYTDSFKNQMQYLRDKGYNVVTMNDLVNFFDQGTPIPKTSVLLTFDDGYEDFYTDAFPVLKSLGFKATVFTPTGLMENPNYLTWDQIMSMGGDVLFANHTWSHKSMLSDGNVDESEISMADTQLVERGLGSPKVFAYPYGGVSSVAERVLLKYAYKLAFSTRYGSILCKKQRFELPRIRIGNSPLSSYGF